MINFETAHENALAGKVLLQDKSFTSTVEGRAGEFTITPFDMSRYPRTAANLIKNGWDGVNYIATRPKLRGKGIILLSVFRSARSGKFFVV